MATPKKKAKVVSKKTVKKVVKKAAPKKAVKKTVKKAAPKKVVKKAAPKKKVPAPKKISRAVVAVKAVHKKPVRSCEKVQTAEGWKRVIVSRLGKKRPGKSLT